jgi:hypothetical protein
MSDKLKKILAVIFLTLLIWAWAYMSLAKSETFTGTLEVSPSADPSLLVTLTSPKSSPQIEISLTSLNFKGAPSRISDLSKLNNRPLSDQTRERLNFYYDPAKHGGVAGDYSLDILDYLQDSSKVRDLALTLESCAPKMVKVTIEQLEEKELPIQCLDKDGRPLKGAKPRPAFVKIYVRKKYNVESATVVLTPQQIEMAQKQQPVEATPYVDLGVANVIRKSAEPVTVVLQNETLLEERTLKPKPIGIFMSQELQNAYKVTILNEEKVRESLSIYATNEAFRAYENMAYPLYIIIKDSDVVDLSKIPPKTIFYNFPPEYVKSGHIEQDETKLPRTADIQIESLNPDVN